jgi:hypothetical protein
VKEVSEPASGTVTDGSEDSEDLEGGSVRR